MEPFGVDLLWQLEMTRGAAEDLGRRIKEIGRPRRDSQENDRLRVNLTAATNKLVRAIEEVQAGLEKVAK